MDNAAEEFQTALRLNVSRRKGILAQIASEISDAEAGLEAINTEERNAEISTIDVALTVKNRSHLAKVMRRLQAIAVINISRKGSNNEETDDKKGEIKSSAFAAIGPYSQAIESLGENFSFLDKYRSNPMKSKLNIPILFRKPNRYLRILTK